MVIVRVISPEMFAVIVFVTIAVAVFKDLWRK